jgi:hypothetical protein
MAMSAMVHSELSMPSKLSEVVTAAAGLSVAQGRHTQEHDIQDKPLMVLIFLGIALYSLGIWKVAFFFGGRAMSKAYAAVTLNFDTCAYKCRHSLDIVHIRTDCHHVIDKTNSTPGKPVAKTTAEKMAICTVCLDLIRKVKYDEQKND